MRRLISGDENDRYVDPKTDLHIIFPYDSDGKLIEESRFRGALSSRISVSKSVSFNFWNTGRRSWTKMVPLCSTKMERSRKCHSKAINGSPTVANQNISKQELAKVLISGTSTRLEASNDPDGRLAANDKRVYSVIPKIRDDTWWYLGILNGRLSTWLMRRISRPKLQGYFDVESQFLELLPVAQSGGARAGGYRGPGEGATDTTLSPP